MKFRNEAQGFVSLFTTIMISLLLLVITVSLISLETLQLRKAEDAEQTLRAYYAAEAGVEDAVSKVLSQQAAGTPFTDQTCTSKTNFDIPGAAGWTCQQISFSGTPSGKLQKAEEAKTIDPGPSNYHSVVIEWSQSTDATASHYNVNLGAGFPSQASYISSLYAAAPIELSIVEYPNAAFAASQVCPNAAAVGCSVKLQNMVVTPGGASGGTVDYRTIYRNPAPFRGNCTPQPRSNPLGAGRPYNCYVVLTHLPNSNTLFRIRSKYLPSAYKMTFMTGVTGNGSPVSVPDGTATIDVTAKAGQTYRRVISKLPLGNSAAAGLNYVMYSDTNICKNFDVINNVAQPGCPY